MPFVIVAAREISLPCPECLEAKMALRSAIIRYILSVHNPYCPTLTARKVEKAGENKWREVVFRVHPERNAQNDLASSEFLSFPLPV